MVILQEEVAVVADGEMLVRQPLLKIDGQELNEHVTLGGMQVQDQPREMHQVIEVDGADPDDNARTRGLKSLLRQNCARDEEIIRSLKNLVWWELGPNILGSYKQQ